MYKKNLTISGESINDENFLKFIGRRGKDRGYMSTMMAKKGGFENAKDVEIIFKAPAGTKGVMLNAALSKEGKFHHGYDVEVEFITARDTSWTIQSVAKMDNGHAKWFQVVAQIDHPSQMNAPTVDQIHNHLANQSANKLSGGETPIPDLDMVAKEVDDLMTPTLTYEVESKSIAKIKDDIAQIEADMKAAGIEPDTETKAMFEDADAYVKATEDYAKAIKQAWICYKGV